MPLIEHIHEDNNDISATDDTYNFFAPPLAHRRTGDKTRDIKKLNLGTLVFESAGNDGERGEFIGCHSAVGTGEFVEEGTFTG